MRRFVPIASAACLVVLACGDVAVVPGVSEPFAVQGGQFLRGELPGAPALPEISPRPTAATPGSLALRPRLLGVPFSGWATADAVSVAARIAGQGDGYWVLPTGPLDPAVPGSRVWRLLADLHEIPPGRHDLVMSALDDAGRAGSIVTTSLCIGRIVPDNGNVCDPRVAPPELVVSLTWDRPSDLDILVVTPDNTIVSSKRTAVGLAEDGRVDRNRPANTAAGVGYLDLDSNRGCALDGRQVENIVFPEKPAPGSYLVYVSLADPCHERVTSYVVSEWARSVVDQAQKTFEPLLVRSTAGRLTDVQASPPEALGTFVMELVVP